jgi:hypothetical protein
MESIALLGITELTRRDLVLVGAQHISLHGAYGIASR